MHSLPPPSRYVASADPYWPGSGIRDADVRAHERSCRSGCACAAECGRTSALSSSLTASLRKSRREGRMRSPWLDLRIATGIESGTVRVREGNLSAACGKPLSTGAFHLSGAPMGKAIAAPPQAGRLDKRGLGQYSCGNRTYNILCLRPPQSHLWGSLASSIADSGCESSGRADQLLVGQPFCANEPQKGIPEQVRVFAVVEAEGHLI